jgi:putative transposase
VCRKHGIAEQTFYRWKTKYGGMDVSDAKRLKALEAVSRLPLAPSASASTR